MIPVVSMQAKTVAVLGLSRTGRSVCRALREGGARVWAWDDEPQRRVEAAAMGVPIVNLDICNWQRVDRLILSPGIPLRRPRPHRLVKRATAAGVEISGDIELLVENQPGRRILGITGTNGKSTTAALVAELLHRAGLGVQLGGNIGLPVLDLLPKPVEDIYVLELSSYQLDLTNHLACAVAVILNLSPDHLERHGRMADYVAAKRRVLLNQGESDCAVIGVDDDHGKALFRKLSAEGRQRVLPISVGRQVERGVTVIDGQLYDAIEGEPCPVVDLRPIASLRGAHNWQNAAAAYAVVRALGLGPAAAAAGMSDFQGLPHRMEPVALIDGVQFVNDSKATNPDAAARALASFDHIHWIAGGRAKQSGLEPVWPWLDRVERAYLIGEAAATFGEQLDGRVAFEQCGDLMTAVDRAAAAARQSAHPEPVVLLAPACASFDQFADFEARGDAFKEFVDQQVPPQRMAAAGRR